MFPSPATSGLEGLQSRFQGMQALVHLLHEWDQQLQGLPEIVARLIGRDGVQRLAQLGDNAVWRLGFI